MRTMKFDGNNQVCLHACIWEPQNPPIGIVQIIHGVAEYTARYDDFASFLAAQGYLVVGEEHPGHGQTADRESLGYL